MRPSMRLIRRLAEEARGRPGEATLTKEARRWPWDLTPGPGHSMTLVHHLVICCDTHLNRVNVPTSQSNSFRRQTKNGHLSAKSTTKEGAKYGSCRLPSNIVEDHLK